MTTPSSLPSAPPRSGTHSRTPRPIAPTVCGLVVALGFPFLPVSRWLDEFADVAHLVRYELAWWAVLAIVLGIVRAAEQRPWSSIGIRPMRGRDVLAALAAGVAMVAGLAGIFFVLFPRLGIQESAPLGQLLATPLAWRIASVVRAAVCEEVLYRGYAIERLSELSRRRGLAAAVSGALFALAHVGTWGWGHLLVAGFGGAVLTALYLWRRNLGANVLAHAIVDAAAVLAG